jgi:hypothetical protein
MDRCKGYGEGSRNDRASGDDLGRAKLMKDMIYESGYMIPSPFFPGIIFSPVSRGYH